MSASLRSRLALAALLASTFALGAMGIGRSLWLDEAWVANSVRAASLREMFYYPEWLQTSPPLFLLLCRGAIRIAGLSNVALRVVPLGFAVLATAAVFAVSRRLFSLPWAVLAATAMAFHPAAIEYSHSMKQYSGELAATALVLLATVVYIHKPAPRSYAVLLATVVVALTFAYPVAFLVPGVLLALGFHRRAMWLGFAATVTLLVLWVILIHPNIGPESRAFLAASGDRRFSPGLIAAALFTVAAAVRVAFRSYRESQPESWRIEVVCALPCVLLTVSGIANWYGTNQRMRLWILPCFAVLLLIYLERYLGRWPAAAWIGVIVLAAIGIRERSAGPQENYQGALQYLKMHAASSDMLLVHAAAREGFLLYSAMEGWQGPQPMFGNTGWPCCARGKNAFPGTSSKSAVIEDLRALLPSDFRGTVWLLYPSRPSHWDYVGLDEGNLWRSQVWEMGCPPESYVDLNNLALSPMNCAFRTTAIP